ncbi:MAG: type III pantothenate kinase [Candidatus Thiodiazotropha lotti]|uniref:Type III pantothenate kinase n=1 Tax=Candidatus Thiodiazotropha endoloripes TaxID=1818881 RepID=A0A1E2UNR5_9GAMM|nr:type III pantothenate kinase [Candidatus Thiodiazotropha endoloripes]MCG7900185.1 type III pantothenate kinase [Candidatus Thiodiazotropha weberae]MCG7993406.1 type III pantothenate kinase [Candidatus Thiodiazotropha lotti]MCG7901076.1 type III pantothenate kinase [Candidatus Thiodiazotropha weberae]MCG7913325.1 type III pantothenate kinase [Candidatus Thiodiazotropha weberae]MCG7998076.1 type III pantothenate kinase [Candidatus Thiodiazotropha lotti]
MKLFVDIGNTAIKWANERELQSKVVHRASSHQIPESIDRAWIDMEVPSEVHIASVRTTRISQRLNHWIAQHWQAEVRFSTTAQQELGVTTGYTTPSQLGVDRWLALLAAYHIGGGPKLVVDCGSATTVDGVDESGRHLGGLILPGLQLIGKCLELNTDLSFGESGLNLNSFATDTAAGIQSGAMLAHLCVVERLLQDLEQRCGKTAECIITGGNADSLSAHLSATHQVIPDLVLQGLALQSAQAE